MKNIDVFILCGGLGKRLRAISKNKPKPMVEVGNKPFLDILIQYLSKYGFRRFILGVGYEANFIKQYYRKKRFKDIELVFSEEKTPLGTGGALKKAEKLIRSNHFFVLNGDSFANFIPENFLNFHKKKKALASILLRKILNGKEYGEIKMDKNSRVLRFNEKNYNAKSCLINAGVYIFDKKVFEIMPVTRNFSLEYDLFPKLIKMGIFGYKYSGFFIDIGTPKRFREAQKYF